MQISSVSILNNKRIDFGYNQNKTKESGNSSLAPSMKSSDSDTSEEAIKELEGIIKDLKSKSEKIQSSNDMDTETKNAELKQINEQINNVENQIAQIKAEKQQEKIEKEKEQAENSAKQNEIQNKTSYKDLGGAIVSASLIDLIAANKKLSFVSNSNESISRLKAEDLDLAFKANDKYALRENSYRAIKLKKNSKSIRGLERNGQNIIKDVNKEINASTKEEAEKINKNKDDKNEDDKDLKDDYIENNH